MLLLVRPRRSLTSAPAPPPPETVTRSAATPLPPDVTTYPPTPLEIPPAAEVLLLVSVPPLRVTDLLMVCALRSSVAEELTVATGTEGPVIAPPKPRALALPT